MIPTPSRILVARDPVDGRKAIDGLAAVAELHLREQPLDGTCFVFVNRRRNALKALLWTHGGFVLVHKRLERGRFAWPTSEADRTTITATELLALLDGLDLSSARKLPRWNPDLRRDSAR